MANATTHQVLNSFTYGDERATAQIDIVKTAGQGLIVVGIFSVNGRIQNTVINGAQEREILIRMAAGENPADIWFYHCI